MSIRDEIDARIKEGRLFPLEPSVPGDPVERCMVISKEIKGLLDGPWENAEHEDRCGHLRGDLEAFVVGDVLAMCLEPYEAKTAYMARLDSPADEVWDVRSRDPDPGLRVFGRFAAKDLFVALTWSPRSVPLWWSLRLPLGDRKSRQWRNQIVQCKTEWTNLFGTYQPVSGADVHDYASNAFLV